MQQLRSHRLQHLLLCLALFHAASAQALTWNNDTPLGAPANTSVRGFWGTAADNIYAVLGSNGTAGKVYRWQGSGWNVVGGTTFDTSPARSIIGFGTQEIWIGGLAGQMRRSLDAGANWTMVNSGTDVADRLTSMWGASNTDIWAGGLNSTTLNAVLRRYNGSSWVAVSHSFGTNEIRGIWGTSANSVFFVGVGGTAAMWNGSSLSPMNTNTTEALTAVWGLNANEVYAVGTNAKIVRWNGSAWSNFPTTGLLSTSQLNGITGTGSNNLYVCTGDGATNLYHWDGSTWTLETTAGNSLNAIWSSPDGTRIVAGGAASRLYGATAAAPTAPEIAVSESAANVADGGSLSFGTTTVGTPVTKTFTITNSGTADLTLSGLTVPSGFSIAQNFVTTTVTPSASTTFQVTMSAAAAGSPSGTLSFTNNDSDEAPYNFTISGTVNPPPAPTVTGVNSTTANGAYGVGGAISIQVSFSANVDVTGGPPTLELNSGGTASYFSGTGTSTLTFNYNVGPGQNSTDLDYTGPNALNLNGGTIVSSVGGVNATLFLPLPGTANSLGANKAIVIDTTAPTVLSVVRQNPTGQNTTSNSVTFRVTYSEPVTLAAPETGHFSIQQVTGTVAGTIASVTGTGSTRDVTVNITSGAGEFRLRVDN